uniref:Uncharacterized protein n=1 Tax=Arundo donax TaxID=35708 RepID=A0A0A9D6I6_ARUDO
MYAFQGSIFNTSQMLWFIILLLFAKVKKNWITTNIKASFGLRDFFPFLYEFL